MTPPDLRPITEDYPAQRDLLRQAWRSLSRESRRAERQGDSARRRKVSELGWLLRLAQEMWRAGQW